MAVPLDNSIIWQVLNKISTGDALFQLATYKSVPSELKIMHSRTYTEKPNIPSPFTQCYVANSRFAVIADFSNTFVSYM